MKRPRVTLVQIGDYLSRNILFYFSSDALARCIASRKLKVILSLVQFSAGKRAFSALVFDSALRWRVVATVMFVFGSMSRRTIRCHVVGRFIITKDCC